MKLGKYFTLAEMTNSPTASARHIVNEPNPAEIEAMTALVANVLDPLREALGVPVRVSSGFRNDALNAAVGGASKSQHRSGEAADILADGLTVPKLVARIHALELPYDQLIDEFGRWVHVSYGPRQRRQALMARTNRMGQTVYLPLDLEAYA